MPESEIPPIIREAFGPALDEPAPPPPATPNGDDGDDGGHVHHVFAVPVPTFGVYGDGSVVANDWSGTLIQGWCWLATFVTVWTVVQAVWQSFSAVMSVELVAVWLSLVGICAVSLILASLAGAAWRRWRRSTTAERMDDGRQP